jgi:hypothetical protein
MEVSGRLPIVKRRSPRTAWIAGLKSTLGAPVLTAAALAGALLVLSGCQAMSPIRTDVAFQPADGVAIDLGDVQIRDLVVIVSAKGEVGTLSGLVVNKGTRPVTITFATGTGDGGGGGAAQAEVPPGDPTRLSGVEGTTPITIPSIDASPGDMIRMTVSTPTAGASEVSVPVLPPTGYYATITPPPAPTVSLTAEPGKIITVPAPTATPTPGQTATP